MPNRDQLTLGEIRAMRDRLANARERADNAAAFPTSKETRTALANVATAVKDIVTVLDRLLE